MFACRNGLLLASEDQRLAQQGVARAVLAWYDQYVDLHRRLHSGRTPNALVLCCGEGGASEGVRRAGGAAHGQDLRDMPRYEQHFGEGTFSKGDSMNPQAVRALQRQLRPVLIQSSPPCKPYSSAQMRGEGRTMMTNNFAIVTLRASRLIAHREVTGSTA